MVDTVGLSPTAQEACEFESRLDYLKDFEMANKQCFTCGREGDWKIVGTEKEYYCCSAHQAQSPILSVLAQKRKRENILDEVWMLYSEKEKSLIYAVERSARGIWNRVIDEEVYGTGITKEALKKRGYVAKKVKICLAD